MKQYLLTIIAVLIAIILALFSIEPANNPYSTRSYRTYGYTTAPNNWSSIRDGTLPVLQEDNTGGVVAPLTEANATVGSLSALPEADAPLNTPPAMLATSAMTELTPMQLPPLDAGMVNVTGGFDGNGQTAGYRVNPRPGEFAIAVPYDPSLLPQGFTEDDIQTYVYDRQYQRWMAIQRDSVNEAELLVCSRFRPWEKGLPHTQNDLANPQDALAQVQDMMSFASQGEGGGDSPLDFINAVLKTPEMPETSAYTPTSIKELKAADPLEGMTLIQPPTANNNGTANLSYPIEIPAGRQGMQPNLALTYSSGGGNGWLGVGWDISIPSITVETRWGVPRYDQSKESEVYVYEGEQLVTKDGNGNFREMPHRTNQWTSRSTLGNEEQFFPRKNEAFDSIVRHGSGPSNYWWTVTHKNGVTDYYGKYASDNGVNSSCVLRTGDNNASGAIAHWALAESVDPYGNSVKYHYVIKYNSGIAGSSVLGKQIYIDSITYTDYNDENGVVVESGLYSVSFGRKTMRSDVVISANRGFKEVTADLLCNISVRYDTSVVRRYYFFMENGPESQYKTRLTDVVRVDSTTTYKGWDTCSCKQPVKDMEDNFKGTCTHFDYYNAPNSDNVFNGYSDYHLPDDTVKSTFISQGFNDDEPYEGRASALGGTKGKSWSLGGTATVGIGVNICMTTVSVGGNFDYSRSQSEGALTLIDLDGDGLADKVFKKKDGVWYRKRIPAANDAIAYGAAKKIAGIPDFLHEVSSTTTWGLQASAGCSFSGGWPTTKSTTSNYFADVNADGLPDLVTEEGVFFNTTQQGGDVSFKSYYVILEENEVSDGESFSTSTSLPCDSFRFDGFVNDSLACEIEWQLESVDTCPYVMVGGCPVYDSTWWFNRIPEIDSLLSTGNFMVTYGYSGITQKPNEFERDNPKITIPDPQHNQPDTCPDYPYPVEIRIFSKQIICTPKPLDPDMDAVKVWVAPYKGMIQLHSDFALLQDNSESRLQSKRVDGVSYAIQHNTAPRRIGDLLVSGDAHELYRQVVEEDDYSQHTNDWEFWVDEGDILFFRLQSNGDRSFDKVNWIQHIYYTASPSGYDQYGRETADYLSIRDFTVAGKQLFQAYKEGSFRGEIIVHNGDIGDPATLRMVFSINGVPAFIPFSLFSGQIDTIPLPLIPLYANDTIKFEASTTGKTNWGEVEIRPHIRYCFVDSATIEPDHHDTLDYYLPVDILFNNDKGTPEDDLEKRLFGPLYRGWGQFAYNNGDASPTSRIDITSLRIEPVMLSTSHASDTNNIKNTPDVNEESSLEEANTAFAQQGMYNPLNLNTRWVEMRPESRFWSWVGFGNINYINKSQMTNTRIPDLICSSETSDIPEYDHPVPQDAVVGGDTIRVKTIRKQNVSKPKNFSMNFSIPVVPISTGASKSNGENKVLTDYMDLNGDRYPDFVGEVYVQYSQPWGGIGKMQPLDQHVQGVSNSSTKSGGVTFGASYSMPTRGTSNNPKNAKISFDGQGNLGASLGGGTDNTDYTFMDMNGDGLPDKVSSCGAVALNIGYSFLPFEQWNCGEVRRGSSRNEGINYGPGSINIAQASISGGVGVNKSENNTEAMLMDMNSDGLPDRVSRVDDGLSVRYSLGNGQWTQPVLLPGIRNISYGASYSESANIGVTAGFTLFGFLKITAGVQTSPYNKTFSKDKVQLTDINGDGYPDYVKSSSETFMRVRYNQSGKTNLLRKVTNFTGASMEMDYALSEQCFDKPQRGWLLDTLTVSDTNSPVAGNVSHTKFKYENPNYNRTERMDYGYGRVTTRQYDVDNGDALYRYTVEEYNNRDFTKRGRKTRDCVYDANHLPYVEHIYGDTLYDFAGSVVADDGCARTDIYVKKETDITNWYEGQQTPQITSVTMREYDRYRNVKEYTHKGDTTHKDEYFKALIAYAQDKPHNLVSLPVSITVYDYSDSILQQRTAEYSDSGKLTRLRRYSDHNHFSLYDFSYDQYGNLETSALPENYSLQRLEFEYEYDNVVHTYPVRVENTSLGYFSTAGYDLRFGKPTVTTDINGNEMRYRYDCLGRNTHIIAPYELAAGKPYTIKMEYHPRFFGRVSLTSGGNEQNYAVTYHYDPEHSDNPIRTVILTDGLGRMLQTRKDAEINGVEQFIVTGKVVYDCFGRTVEQYQPFPHDTLTLDIYLPDCDTSRRTVCEYDILDRQIHTTVHPYGYTTDIEYGFGSVGNKTCFRTVTTDAMGNADTVLKGTMGQQLEQRSPMGAVTRFVYDHLGQLKQTTDPDGFSTYYDYDWFGQLTHRHHPDAGNDWYKYDAMGNMVCHVNALGDSVKNRYYFSLLTDVEFPRYPANNVHYQYGTASDTAINAVGKIKFQEDGSGFQTFKYGKLGELTENIRTFALPFESRTYTFKMQYEYDSWNRIQTMTYPDGEVVHYDYNLGGMLEKVYGQVKVPLSQVVTAESPQCQILPDDQTMGSGILPIDFPVGPIEPSMMTYSYRYIDSIAYNEYELKSEVFYGNGTHTQYDYDDIQRMQTLQSQTRTGATMQSITYSYDAVNNITDIVNMAGALSNGLGGIYSHYYEYDDLYRLVNSFGQWDNTMKNEHLKDTVRMAYYKNGRIASKKSYANIYSEGGYGTSHATQNSRRAYNYNIQQPNTLSNVYDSVTNTSQNFSWDNSGNMVAHNGRSHSWTEDNRLLTVTDNEWFSYYQYDAGGDRTYKLPYLKTYSNRSGRRSVYWAPEHSTLYASPYLVVTPQGYTKHYYAESERITSQIGRGNFSTLATPVTDTATANRKVRRADSLVLALNPGITDTAAQLSYLTALTNRQKDTCEAYWYHSDHLGSSSWITDSAGNPVQHLHYLPWGEDYVNQRLNDFDGVRYTFSAKEKDSETGLSYFGSRYYSSDLSVWLSVDPQAAKYPSLSPYTYCADNPVKLVDPNGEDFVTIIDDKNKTITIKATYYAANKDKKLLQQGIDLWMQQSEKYSYTMEKDGQSIPYTIKFDLSIAEGDYATSFDAKSAMPTHQGMNFFEVLPEVKGSDNNPIRGKCISGFGINVSNDYTLAGYDPVRTAAHEIGHSLGCADTFLQDDLMVSGGRGSAIGINNIRAIMFMGGFDNFGFANVGNDNGHSANAHKLGTYFGTVIKN